MYCYAFGNGSDLIMYNNNNMIAEKYSKPNPDPLEGGPCRQVNGLGAYRLATLQLSNLYHNIILYVFKYILPSQNAIMIIYILRWFHVLD